MKKVLVILTLVMIVGFGAFANGNSDAGDADAPVKLVLAIWGGDNDKAVMESLLRSAASELDGIEVEVLLLAEYDKTITTRLVGGEQIDIMAVAEAVHQFSSRNQLEPLNDYIADRGLDMEGRFGAAKNLYARNGLIYALPLRGGPMVVYSNMDLLDAKPELDWSFDDYMEAAKSAYRKGATTAETTWGFVPAGTGVWWPWYTSFIYAAGGSILDDAGEPNFDDPKTIKGLAHYAAFIPAGVSPSLEDMADIGQNSPDPVFNSGKAGMITTGWWNVSSLEGADFNWDVAPIPNGEGRGTVIFGQGLAVTSLSENKEAAFKVIEALTGTAAQTEIVNQKWDIPANVDVLNSDIFLKAPWSSRPLDMQAVADAIAKGAISLPYHEDWNQIHDIIGNVVNELLKGNLSAEEAAERIQAELTSQVFSN